MKEDLVITSGIIIPEHEFEITASRSGGPGGQHVNKSSTKITVRWNIVQSTVLDQETKERLLDKLRSRVTTDGDLIVHSSESRSQVHNKKLALMHLAQEIRGALVVPKKRKKTSVSKSVKEARLHKKAQRSEIKKLRSKKIDY